MHSRSKTETTNRGSADGAEMPSNANPEQPLGNFLDLFNPADQLWEDIRQKLVASITAARAAGDQGADAYFSAKRGSPSVYVPFGFHAAKMLNVDLSADAYVSSRGKGFENHKERILTLLLEYKLASLSWTEKCGLDLCLAHPVTNHVTFAYEAEMDKIPPMPASASQLNSAGFNECDEKRFYLTKLKDLDKLLQIDCDTLFYLGCVGNNDAVFEIPKLKHLIERRARMTLEASCSPQRKLVVLLTTGRKMNVGSSYPYFHYAMGLWAKGRFFWTMDLRTSLGHVK